MNRKYYYKISGLGIFTIIIVSIVVAQSLFSLLMEEEPSTMMIMANTIAIVMWGILLLLNVWVLIPDRFNLSFIEIDERGITKRNGCLRTSTATFEDDFNFREKKGRIQKVVIFDVTANKRMVIGNGFELPLKDLKTIVKRKKDKTSGE